MKANISLLLIFAFICLFASKGYAQYSVNMVDDQTITIDGCQHPSGTIYDNGGPNGNYSNSFDGYVVIQVPTGITINLQGNYNTENCCDPIYVYDGNGATGTTLVDQARGSGSINTSSTTGYMTVYFHTDGSVINTGFALNYSCSGVGNTCTNGPTGLTVSNITTSSAQVFWNAPNTSGPFLVNFNGTISTVSTNSMSLTGLSTNTHYDIAVCSQADNWGPCCTARKSFRTACGSMDPPMIENFDDYGIGYNILPTCWTKLLNYDDTLKEPQIVGNPYSSAPGALQMYCGNNDDGNHYSMVIGPRMNVSSMASMKVRLTIRAAYSGTYLIVGVCDSTMRTNNNFTPVDTITIDNTNTWETKVVDLSSYTGSGKYLALRMQRSLQWGNNRYMFVEDVALLPCGTWNERLYDRNYNSMWLAFDTIGSPTVNIEYGPSGFIDGSGTTVNNVTSPYHITGLQPSTYYEVRIHSTCGSVTETRNVIQTTLDAPHNLLNLCEDFDSTSTLPNSWIASEYCDNTPYISSSEHYSGNNSLYMRGYSSYCHSMIALPPIDTVTMQSLNVRFSLLGNGGAQVIVGVMEYPENTASFVPIDTLQALSGWNHHTVSLQSYAGTGRYIAFWVWYDYVYIDNIEVSQCALQNIQITNVTNRSAQVVWDPAPNGWPGSNVTIEYGGQGFAMGSGTTLTASASQGSVSITGLSADSTYDIIIYANCDTMVQSCGMERRTIHTLDRQLTPAYCEDFETYNNYDYPAIWYRPQMYEGRPRVSNYRAFSGMMSLNFYSYNYYNNQSMAVLPLIEVDASTTLYFTCWYNGSTNGDTNDYYLELGLVSSPEEPASFTSVARFPLYYNVWELASTEISNYTGTSQYLALRTHGTWGVECWVDDISITTCQVRNVTFDGLTNHSTTLHWTLVGQGSDISIEYGPVGFLPGTGTRVTASGNSYTIDGLAADSTYDIYLWGNCTNDVGFCATHRYSFHTLAEPTVTTYCQNFDSFQNGSFPNGMYRPWVFDNHPHITNEGNPGNCMTFRAYKYYNYDSNSTWMVLPLLEESDLSGVSLNFDLRQSYNDAQSHLTIGLMTDPTDTTTFTAVCDTNPAEGWHHHSIPLSNYNGTGRYIAFHYHYNYPLDGYYNDYVYLDNLTIERCGVGNIESYSTTAHDTWLSWDTRGSTDNVVVKYGLVGDTTSTVVNNATSPLHLENLTEGTTYQFTVTANCTGSTQACNLNTYTFTTRTDSIVPGYCDGFDGMNSWQMPTHWTMLQGYSSYPRVADNSNPDYWTSSPKAIEFYTCSGANEGNFIVMPATESSVAGHVVTFNLRCSNSDVRGRAQLTVGVMTLPYDSTTFVPMATIYPTFQWQRYSVDLGNYSGTARHIAFRYKSLNGCHYIYMDDLGYSLCRPGDLRVQNITDQSVLLQWQSYGTTDGSTTYTIEYGLEGFSRGTGTFIHTNNTSYTITGLSNDSDYRFYVWSTCQDSNSCQEETLAAHTLDEPLLTPFCNNFDNEPNEQLPADWIRCYGDIYPRISNWGYRTSPYALQFYSYNCNNWSDQTSMAAMPMVSVDDIRDLQLDFYYYNENSNATLEIGVMTNPRDTNTFTVLHTLQTSNSWARIKRSLASYSGTGHYVAFRYKCNYCSSGYAYIDDLTLRTCAITSCSLNGLGPDGVDVTWHATSGTQGVWMTYGALGGGQSTPTFHTSSPIHISGLGSATEFEVRLWPQCDSVTDNCNYERLVEQTLHPEIDIPFCTNFDGLSNDGFPNNWRRLSTVGNNYPRATNYRRHSESYSMYFYATDTLYSLAAMPTIRSGNSCIATNQLYVNFWTYFSGYTDQGRMVIGVMDNILDTNSFVALDTVTSNVQEWVHHTVSLSGYSGSSHIIAMKFLSNNGYWCECYVDDLCVEKCVAADVEISDITQNSITITWTGNSTEGLIVEYGEEGFAHGHGTMDTITTSPYTLTGLNELTTYEFIFTSLCNCNMTGATYPVGGGSGGIAGGGGWGGGGGGGIWGGFVITTQAHFLEVPYCESFEGFDTMDFLPSWRRIPGSSNLYPALTHSNHHGGDYSMALYTTTDTATYMSLPPLPVGTTQEMVMTFYAYATNYYATNTDALHVGVMTNPDDPSTYTEVTALRMSNHNQWQQLSVDFANYTGTGQYITFRFKPIYGSYFYYIDDLYVGRCGITNVQFATTPNSVQVSWTALHTPTGVTIEYGRQGYAEDSSYTPTTVYTTSNPYTITGIDPDSNYDFYVMAHCSDTDVALCSPVVYTLNPMMYPPYCLDFEDVPSGAIPTDWKVLRGRSQYPLAETQYYEQIMAFYPCTDNDNVVLMRPLPSGETLQGKWVYARFSTQYDNYIFLDFGTVSDTTNANTFVQMGSMSNGSYDIVKEFNVQLQSSTPVNNRFALRARSTSGCRWIRLCDLALADYPYPTGIGSTLYGTASRLITWNNEYNNAYYTVEYGHGDQWQTATSDSCQVLLTGLAPGTEYEVYFISPNGDRICLPYRFTNPDAVGLPYCENFDQYEYTANIEGWHSFSSYGDNYPRTYSYCYNSCCRTLDFYCDYSHLQYIAMPDFAVDSVKNLDLQFSLRIEDINRTKLVVGVMTDRTDFSTFVALDSLTCPTSQTHYPQHITLSNYQGEGRYVAFQIHVASGGRTSIFLDDLKVSGCPQPIVSVASSHSVMLRMPEAAEAALVSPDYWVEFGLEGCQQGDEGNRKVHIVENPAYIDSLIADSTYSFFCLCSEEGTDCQPQNIKLANQLPLPYCDDFSNPGYGQLPTGWANMTGIGISQPYINYYGEFYFHNDCNGNNRSYAIMPDIGIDSIKYAEIYFDQYSYYPNSEYLLVGVMDNRNDTATFTPVDTVRCSASYQWQPQHVSMKNYTGDGRFIAFRATNPNGCMYIFMDNLKVNSHPMPHIGLSDATTVVATTDCDRPEDYWLEYGPQGIAQGDSTNSWLHVTSCTAEIAGLDTLTTYTFYHHVDSGDVTCFPPIEITTSTIVSMPYCEDFEHFEVTELSEGWSSSYECNRSDVLAHTWYIDYSWAQSKALDLTGYCNQWVLLPSIDLAGNTDIQFSCRLGVNGYWDRQYIVVGTMADRTDPSTFNPVDTIRCTSNSVYQWRQVDLHGLDGNRTNIAFRYINTVGGYSLYMDDIVISPLPQPSAQLVGYNTIRLYYDSAYAATDYWVRLTTPDSVDTMIYVDTNPYYIRNLDELSTYTIEYYYDSTTPSCFPPETVNTSRLQAIPYCEPFYDYGYGYDSYPTGWARMTRNNDRSMLYVQNDGDAEDNRSLGFSNYNNRESYAVLPEMDLADMRNATLRVKMWTSSGSDPNLNFLEVGIMTDRDDTNSFELIDTLMNTQSGSWEYLSVSLASVTSTGRFIALRHRTFENSWRYIYIDRLEIVDCDLPASVTAGLNRHNVIRIDGSEPTSTGFWVEYGLGGFTQGTGTFLHVDTLPTDITLSNQTTYDFYFYCDTAVTTCIPKQTITTLPPPLTVPLCYNFDTCRNSYMPYGWTKLLVPNTSNNSVYVSSSYSHSTSRSLRFYAYYTNRYPHAVMPDLQVDSLSNLAVAFWMYSNNCSNNILEIGVMSDPNDPSSFITIKRFQNSQNNTWEQMRAVLTDAPDDAHFIAFKFYKTDNYTTSYLYLDDIYVSTCGASDFRVTELASTHISFDWEEAGDPLLTLEYGPVGFASGTGTTLHPTHHPITISNLNNLTNYEFRFQALCELVPSGYCVNNYYDTVTLFTPAGGTGCIDPTNLTATYTTCTYGTYANPRSNEGIVNYGYQSALSRHTVHFDTTERDVRTGGLLRTIPQGSEAAVRLGNWSTGGSTPEAESITYSLFVDPASFDLLILRYAAVLQDPEHSPSQQPRFSIEILDEDNNLIDEHCGAADFIANAQLGWNLADNDVLWKDWTTVGLDMSAYANQTVRIRLTTYDCGEGSHYGYAYFTLGCLLKNILSESCGDVAANTYTMPDGFNYNWYTDTVNKTTLYNTQTVTIPTANSTYYCDLSFIDDATCYFTMSTYVGTRYPLALYDSVVTTENCQFHVHFNNLSTISNDGINPIGTGEGCESAYWDFGNGQTSTEYNGSTVYTTPGTYQVMLISYIGGGTCADTIIKPLILQYPSATPAIVGPTERCQQDPPDTLRVLNGVSFNWLATQQDSFLVVSPNADANYTCIVTNIDGCTDTLTHSIEVHPIYSLVDTLTLCSAELPYQWRDTLLGVETVSDTFNMVRSSMYGCDSLQTLQLTVNYASSGDTTAVVCDSMTWYGTVYTATPTTEPTHLLVNQYGCDSVLTLHLTVGHSSDLLTYDTVTENSLPYMYNGHSLVSDTTIGITLTNTDGCDSTIGFHLHVIWNNRTTVDSTICDSQLPLTWNSRIFTAAGTQYDTLTNSLGSDSLLTMILHVLPTYNLEFYDTICSNQSMTFDGVSYTLAGDYTDSLQTLTTPACDSVRTLHLTVFNTTVGDTLATACDQFTWYGQDYTSSAVDTLSGVYSNAHGCDSSVVLHLTVNHSTAATYYDTCTESQLPRSYMGITAYGDTANAVVTLTNAVGCDSVVTYNLHVIWNNRTTVDSTVCDSQLPLTWNHRIFTGAGTQYDTLTNSLGSDSLLTMILHVLPTYNLEFYDTICSNQSMTFDGATYNLAGDYTDSLQTHTTPACDSIRTLHLTVFNTTLGDSIATACDQFTWYGQDYNISALDTLTGVHTNAHGCDSSVVLHLTVNYSSTATYYDTCTENQLPRSYLGLTVYGDTANAIITSTNAVGCDSVVTYNLHVIWNNHTTVDSTICDSQLPLTWNNRIFTAAGTQYDTLTNSIGSDSLLTMVLHVLPTYNLEFYDTICNNQAMTFDGVSYTLAGNYTDSLQTLTSPACDSVRTLHLTVFNTTVGDTLATACDQFTWYGQTFTSTPTTTPTHLTTNVHGCDSTVSLNLTIHYSDAVDDYDTICENALIGGYTWRDTLLSTGTTTGNYAYIRPNQWGCDSTLTLHLLVHYNTSHSVYDTIVENQADSWQYNGFAVTHDTSNMMVTLVNQWNCDSVVNYNLFVWPNEAVTVDSTICDDAVADFLWQSHSFADTLQHTFLNGHGADSVVTLAMHVNPTYDMQFYDTICDNASSPFVDTAYNTAGTYTHHLVSTLGCDSAVTLHLTVHPTYDFHFYDTIYLGQTVTFEDTTLGIPGDYAFRYSSIEGCDSVLTLHLKDITLTVVELTDSICEGDTVFFAGMPLTMPGVYRDTVAGANPMMGDTLKVLTLYVLPYPTISFDTSHICGSSPHYTLEAHTGVPYLQWTSLPYDESLDDHEGDSILYLNPSETTLYHLFADYGDTPLCPSTDSILLTPIQTVTALIEVQPEYLTYDRRLLVARNASSGYHTQKLWQVWFYDGDYYTDTASMLRFEVPLTVDSVRLTLAVSNAGCADTDTVMVPSIVSSIFFPNIFTPALNENNRFGAVSNGIQDYELWIYDRRGDLVFHSTDINEQWDGTHDGRPCQQASYVYRCRYSTTLEPKAYKSITGTVTLVR